MTRIIPPVEKDSPNNGIGLTWDDGAALTASEGKAWWAGWNEGNIDGRADALDELRDEIERLREALREIIALQKANPGPLTLDDYEYIGYEACADIARAALGEGE